MVLFEPGSGRPWLLQVTMSRTHEINDEIVGTLEALQKGSKLKPRFGLVVPPSRRTHYKKCQPVVTGKGKVSPADSATDEARQMLEDIKNEQYVIVVPDQELVFLLPALAEAMPEDARLSAEDGIEQRSATASGDDQQATAEAAAQQTSTPQ